MRLKKEQRRRDSKQKKLSVLLEKKPKELKRSDLRPKKQSASVKKLKLRQKRNVWKLKRLNVLLVKRLKKKSVRDLRLRKLSANLRRLRRKLKDSQLRKQWKS